MNQRDNRKRWIFIPVALSVFFLLATGIASNSVSWRDHLYQARTDVFIYDPLQDAPTLIDPFYGVVAADFDKDGFNDIAISKDGVHKIAILPGKGNGTFGPRTDYPSGPNPRFVVARDLNGDTYPDLLIANYYGDSISALLNQLDGTFGETQYFQFGEYEIYHERNDENDPDIKPIALETGDFNNDGILDVVAVANGRDSVWIFRGIGDGSFAETSANDEYKVDGTGPVSVSVADFNGDGNSDLAVANMEDNNITVLSGNGDGSFQIAGKYKVGRYPRALAVGFLDEDATIDLAVANAVSNDISLLIGKGDGTFHTHVDCDSENCGTGKFPRTLSILDINRDGHQDMVAANVTDNTVSVILGNGNGTFQTAKAADVGYAPYSTAIADFDGDALLDIICVNEQGKSFSILLGNGDGTFITRSNHPVNDMPNTVIALDVNNDGFTDMITANERSANITVILNKSGGCFEAAKHYDVGRKPADMAAGDFNNDGYPDLAVADKTDYNITIMLGNENGVFTKLKSFDTGKEPRAIVSDDFNTDGNLDLATINFMDHSRYVHLGKGNGEFESPLVFDLGNVFISDEPGDWNVNMINGNVDGDNIPDLIIVNAQNNEVGIYLGLGTGEFEKAFAKSVGKAGDAPYAAALGHFNLDENIDLVVANKGSNTVSILLGNGDGSFNPETSFKAGDKPVDLSVGDIDEDGYSDIVVANLESRNVSALFGNGDGTFESLVAYGAGDEPFSVLITDMDTDKDQDIVIANAGNDDVSILTNNLRFPPVIDSFSADITSGENPLTVNFNCVAHDPDGNITRYETDFGDGSGPISNDSGAFSYTYANDGEYDVVCTVTDNHGARVVSDSIAITVDSGGGGTCFLDSVLK